MVDRREFTEVGDTGDFDCARFYAAQSRRVPFIVVFVFVGRRLVVRRRVVVELVVERYIFAILVHFVGGGQQRVSLFNNVHCMCVCEMYNV